MSKNNKNSEVEDKVENIFDKLIVKDENNLNLRWYLVQTHSNAEKAAVRNIWVNLELKGVSKLVKEVIVPSVEIVKMVNGQKRKVNKKLYPGYILVFAEMSIEVCSNIVQARKVLSFLDKSSSSLLPRPVPHHEVERMITQLRGYSDDKASLLEIREGSVIRISEGSFEGHIGRVLSLNINNGVAKVIINILGRDVDIDVPIETLEITS